MRIGDKVTYVGHEDDGIKGAIGVLDSQDLPGIWNVKLASSGQIVVCKTTELELSNPEPIETPRKIRKGDRVALNQDLLALDNSTVVKPNTARGTVKRARKGIAHVYFDDGDVQIVFTWKLAFLPKGA